MFISSSTDSNKIHLIIGGGYISEFHIRASLANKFKVFVVEIDLAKRRYLKYLFPNVFIFSSVQKVIKEFDINTFELISILIPIHYRKNLYKELPEINSKVLLEKPITSECLKKFDNNRTFICLNQAYNKSGFLINKSLFDNKSINKISTLRPNPKELLRQNSLSDYLLDYLPHTLTPLHLIYGNKKPSLKIEKIKKEKLSGLFLINEREIPFEVLISENNFDTFIHTSNGEYSYDNSLLEKNSYLYKFKKNFYTISNIMKNRWGYSTMYKMYHDLRYYLPNSDKYNLLNKLLIKSCSYLVQ